MFLPSLQKTIKIQLSNPWKIWQNLVFLGLLITVFGIGLSNENEIFKNIAHIIVLQAFLILSILSTQNLFLEDCKNGTIDLMICHAHDLPRFVLGKIMAFWFCLGLPFSVAASFFLAFTIEAALWPVLLVSICSVFLFFLIGAVGAALSISSRAGALLLGIVLIPCYLPVFIFSLGAFELLSLGLSFKQPVLFLCSILAIAIPSVPYICASCLRHNVQ